MDKDQNFEIHLDSKFGFLNLIDVNELVAEDDESWYNQTLCRVNDCVVRYGIFPSGEFHWHKHEEEDEFFFVLEGELVIELENRPEVVLHKNMGFNVPKGMLHKPRVNCRTVVLMVEGANIDPHGTN